MTLTLDLVLYIIAFICFVCAAAGWSPSSRVNLIAAGLAFWVLTAII